MESDIGFELNLRNTKGINLCLVFIMLMTLSAISCKQPVYPPLPIFLLEEVAFREATLSDGELRPYMYPGLPRIPESNLTPDEDILVRDMIINNWEYSIKYNSNKAVAVVDLSNTGFVEWLNINKFRQHPLNNFDRLSTLYLSFEYKDRQWWYVTTAIPYNWDGFDEEKEQARLSDN